MGSIAIDLRQVAKKYKIYTHPRQRFLEALWRGRRIYHQDFWALQGVTVEIPKGKTIGVIGENGSGKSTLLQVIAGIVRPTLGEVIVDGRISALLELGAGFNPEFSGRENVLMNGGIQGLSRKQMEARLPKIAAFAEIGEFFEQPVRTYSTGMYVRLAFATAIHVDPEILLVDEALAVGDVIFQHRCIQKIKEFQAAGKTIVFVSHDMSAVKSVCDMAVFLCRGQVVKVSDPDEVVNFYLAYVAEREASRSGQPYRQSAGPGLVPSESSSMTEPAGGPPLFRADPHFEQRAHLFRHGTGEARIRNVEIFDEAGRAVVAVSFGQQVCIRVHMEFLAGVPDPILGFLLRDRHGVDVVGINTWAENRPLGPRKAGERLVVDFVTSLSIRPGSYSVSPALSRDPFLPQYLDWVDNACVFEVMPANPRIPIYGIVHFPTDIRIHDGSPL